MKAIIILRRIIGALDGLEIRMTTKAYKKLQSAASIIDTEHRSNEAQRFLDMDAVEKSKQEELEALNRKYNEAVKAIEIRHDENVRKTTDNFNAQHQKIWNKGQRIEDKLQALALNP